MKQNNTTDDADSFIIVFDEIGIEINRDVK